MLAHHTITAALSYSFSYLSIKIRVA